MTHTNGRAPGPEWVELCRRGIPAPKIAAAAGVAETTVRYRVAIAAEQEPDPRDAHRPPCPHRPNASQRQASGTSMASCRSTRLRGAAARPRQVEERVGPGQVARPAPQGRNRWHPLPRLRSVLDSILNWRSYPTKRDSDEAR
jgi:hypothetical protein